MTTQLPSMPYTIEDLHDIAYRGSYSDMERKLARALLAVHEQEPIYLVPIDDEPGRSRRLWLEVPATNWMAKAFYAHPAPSIQAAVPDESQSRELFEAWFASDCSFDCSPEATDVDNYAWKESLWYTWEKCRAAMLKEYKS